MKHREMSKESSPLTTIYRVTDYTVNSAVGSEASSRAADSKCLSTLFTLVLSLSTQEFHRAPFMFLPSQVLPSSNSNPIETFADDSTIHLSCYSNSSSQPQMLHWRLYSFLSYYGQSWNPQNVCCHSRLSSNTRIRELALGLLRFL